MIEPDEMSMLARDAAMAVSGIPHRLHYAADMEAPRAVRVERLTQVFAIWRSACIAMSALEGLAPNCAAKGYERAQRAKEFAAELQLQEVAA